MGKLGALGAHHVPFCDIINVRMSRDQAHMEGLSAWEEDHLGAHHVPFFLERAPLPGFLELFGANLASADYCPVHLNPMPKPYT